MRSPRLRHTTLLPIKVEGTPVETVRLNSHNNPFKDNPFKDHPFKDSIVRDNKDIPRRDTDSRRTGDIPRNKDRILHRDIPLREGILRRDTTPRNRCTPNSIPSSSTSSSSNNDRAVDGVCLLRRGSVVDC
jgi:hypothetical protein